ncbi:MAG TPA: hypothetical protein VGM90_12415 [Kofleriaceae bacterium]|jgi:hypothetical protein
MNLVEAEEVGPVEGDAPLVTPPRPPHRRVSVSLLFTMTVLIGTVVAIYMRFPARHDVLLDEAIARHVESDHDWDLTSPTPAEARAWVKGFAGKELPLPASISTIQGAKQIEILDRSAAVMRLSIGSDDVTYLCQRARGVAPGHTEKKSDSLVAYAFKQGVFTCVVVGTAATESTWHAAFPK